MDYVGKINELIQTWVTGELMDPAQRDTTFERFYDNNVVIDSRFPAKGTPYESKLGLLHGKEGLFLNMEIMTLYQMRDPSLKVFPGAESNEVLMKCTYEAVASSGKSYPYSHINEFKFDEHGKIIYFLFPKC